MRIQEIMSQPVVTCRSTDTLNTAAQLMWEYDIGSVPVVDEEGSIVGVVTDRDVCMAAYTEGNPLRSIPVSNAMAKQVYTCQATDTLEEAERVMSEKQIRRVPIVDSGSRPVGFLSLNDIARRAASSPRKDGIHHELTQTLAAICEPRLEGARVEAQTAQRG